MKKLQTLIKEYMAKGLAQSDLQALLKLSRNEPATFQRLAQRRLFGEPFAYLSGTAHFMGRPFTVDRRVYVPNPETEQMVQIVLKSLKPGDTVVDVGTGCGSIAITIARERPDVHVYGVDLAPCALAVARLNAQCHSADVTFCESYYIDDLTLPTVDVIVSDLPYGNSRYTLPSVDLGEFEHMPPLALFHPRGPLTAYEELIASIRKKRWTPALFMETG